MVYILNYIIFTFKFIKENGKKHKIKEYNSE